MGMIEAVGERLRRQLASQAGKVNFCSKGGPHFAKNRKAESRCEKCGKTVAEIKAEIAAAVAERYPAVIQGGDGK